MGTEVTSSSPPAFVSYSVETGLRMSHELHSFYLIDLLLWPNFAVFELAPTTAKFLDEKNVLRDASVLILVAR